MTKHEQELMRRMVIDFGNERRGLKNEIEQLGQANAELRVEREAADLLLGQAIALLREHAPGQW